MSMIHNDTLPERVALTGASSFLNSLLLKHFAASPAVREVHIFDIRPPSVTSNKFIFHRVDLRSDTSPDFIASILIENSIPVFIHGALFSGPTRKKGYHHEVESIGTYHLLTAIAWAKTKRLIVQSDTFVYGANPKNPNFISENYPLPNYGPQFVRTRVDVENQIQEFSQVYRSCEVTVLRFAPILGPSSTNIRARYFFAGIVPKVLGYDPLMQFIHENDAVRAMLKTLSLKTKGVFNIAGKGLLPLSTGVHMAGKIPVPFLQPVCKTFFTAGYLAKIWELPADMVPFFQYLCVADVKKSSQVLGFTANYSSRQALKSVIEANRLRHIGFPMPSPALGEDREFASGTGFRRVH